VTQGKEEKGQGWCVCCGAGTWIWRCNGSCSTSWL